MSHLKFAVEAHSENPTKTVVKTRGFEIIIDEPESMGGTNQGANPVEYVLSAYAGCLNVMGHVCAKEMGFELRGLTMELAGTLNPDRLFGKSYQERAGYQNIEVKMHPDCDADEQTLEEWKEKIIDRCPVGDNLKHATEVIVKVL